MAKRRPIKIGQHKLGGRELLFILGPCVIETPAFTRRMADRIKKICDGEGASFVFKASYDKANRTSAKSFRGTSVRDGCALLAEIGAAMVDHRAIDGATAARFMAAFRETTEYPLLLVT